MAILSFRDSETEAFFRSGKTRKGWQRAAPAALRKLDQLNAAVEIRDLAAPPGNRLEALTGDHSGSWSIRINDQWRICFVWTTAGAEQVEITDYH
jgi:proteic killer suppression protein